MLDGLTGCSGTGMCRRDARASARRGKRDAALPRPFVRKPRQDARFCEWDGR